MAFEDELHGYGLGLMSWMGCLKQISTIYEQRVMSLPTKIDSFERSIRKYNKSDA
jgi:hypothetical protein